MSNGKPPFTMNRANFDFGNGSGLTGLTGGKSSPLKIWPILVGIGKAAAAVGKAGVAVGTAVGKAATTVGGAVKTGAQAVGGAIGKGAQAVGDAGKFVGEKVSKGAKDFAGKEGFVSDVIDNVEKFAEKNPRAYRGIKGGVSGIDQSVKKHNLLKMLNLKEKKLEKLLKQQEKLPVEALMK